MRTIPIALAVFVLALLTGCSSSSKSVTVAKLSTLDMSSFISLTEAVAIAQTEVPGGIAVAAELEVEDDDENEPPAFEVVLYVEGDQQLIEVEVDATTGDVLEVEVSEDGDDDEGEDDDA